MKRDAISNYEPIQEGLVISRKRTVGDAGYAYHRHDACEILLFLEGDIRFYIEQTCFVPAPGSLVILNPNEMHRVQSVGDTPYERIVLNGTEVRIKCQAYDPYDPLRGRYLGMTVSEECTNILFRVEEQDEYAHHKDVFAKLAEIPGRNGIYRVEAVAKEPDGNGLWAKCESASFGYLLEWNAQKKDESNEEFWKRRNKSGRKAVVSFPDQLFVNEKIAPEAEKLLRKRTASAVVWA